MCTLNFMWMHDMSVGLAALAKKDFQEKFLDEIENKEYTFIKELLKHIFVAGIKIF
jgi:hypothetical protein